MLGQRGGQVRVARFPVHGDPVAHVQPVGLSSVLDQPDDFPGQPLTAQFRGDGHLDADGLPALRRDGPALPRSLGHDHVIRAEGDRAAVHLDRDLARRPQLGAATWGGEPEIHAISKCLKRPIIVVHEESGINFDTQGYQGIDLPFYEDPIFIYFTKGRNHYNACLIRGEGYLEEMYSKRLMEENHELQATVVASEQLQTEYAAIKERISLWRNNRIFAQDLGVNPIEHVQRDYFEINNSMNQKRERFNNFFHEHRQFVVHAENNFTNQEKIYVKNNI